MSKRVIAFVLSISLICTAFTAVSASGNSEEKQIQNIIYMIPAGGGMGPYYLAEAVKKAGGYDDKESYPYVTQTGQGDLYMSEYLCGAITTYSADNEVTDSAAAGTALSTGFKTNNGYIGILPSYAPTATILEASELLGKSTGMVTTYDWANATPAAFSAHDISRSNNLVISEQVINQDIDVVLGVGFGAAFAGVEEAEKRGYDIINNRSDLQAVKKGDRIWGNLEEKSFPYDIDNTADTVTLAEMTKAALKALSDSSDEGFFLMVEGSQVDGGGHKNNAKAMVGEFLAFDEAFGVAIEYAKGRDDTVVIACPDHDTGGMNLPEDIAAAVEALRNGEQPEEVTWTSTGHTKRNGGLFIYVPEGVAYPDGINADAENPFEDNVIDNNEIIPYLAGLIGADLEAATNELFVDVTDMGTYYTQIKQFIFNDYPVSVMRNASYAFYGDKVIDLGGQVAVYVEGKFYVPKMLLDIMENGTYDEHLLNFDLGYKSVPVFTRLNFTMLSADEASATMTLNNYFANTSASGYVEFKAPQSYAALGKIDFGEIKGGEEKTITLDCKDVYRNGCDFEYEIVLDNGERYPVREHFDGIFYAAYTEKPITIDGIIDDEWKNSSEVVIDDSSMLHDEENWKGYRDLSATIAAMYDEDYFYFYSIVTDEIFCQEMEPTEVWKGDSIQTGLYNDTEGLFAKREAGAKYEGLNYGLIHGEPKCYRSKSASDLCPYEVLEENEDFEFKCSQDGINTIYEIKVSWKEMFGYEVFPRSGDMYAFSFLVNDNDGEGRRGAMYYGDGIYGTKNVNEFLPMYLIDTTGNSKPVETRDITVYNNGEKIEFSSNPFILSDRTMVFAEEFLNAVGIAFDHNDDGNIVIPTGDTEITLVKKEMFEGSDVMCARRNGIMFAPLRALCDIFGRTVSWDGETRSVYVE